MNLSRRLAFIFVTTLFFSSCGGGESSSGSGIGGTGITLVQGNISSVNGQFFVYIRHQDSQPSVIDLTKWIIPLSYAQSVSSGSVIVSGGGQSTTADSSGEFELPGVTPSANFVLTFKVSGANTVPLGIGEVVKGATVTVKNISIDTKSGSARPTEIDVTEPEETEDDTSEDDTSEDDTSEDTDNNSEDNPDDTSEDGPEDEEDSDDSIDDVSHDDEK